MPNAKEQLELLTAHQKEFESFLKELTGLSVTVSLTVHTTDNLVSDLLALFDASLSLSVFRQVTTSERTWITHEALNRNISVFMPKDFKVIESFPELDDDEGYAQAVEVANAKHTGYPLKYDNDYNPF